MTKPIKISLSIKVHLGRACYANTRTLSLSYIWNYHDLVSSLNHHRAIIIAFVAQQTIGFTRCSTNHPSVRCIDHYCVRTNYYDSFKLRFFFFVFSERMSFEKYIYKNLCSNFQRSYSHLIQRIYNEVIVI